MAKRKQLEDKTRSELIKELDEVFSIFIRLFWANNDGFCTCFTCPKRLFWKYITCGHFQSRGIFALRWEEDNCRPQCMFPCNGNMDSKRTATYQLNLVEDLGQDRVNDLLRIASSHKEWLVDKSWYIEKIRYYKAENVKLLKRVPEKHYT